MDAQRLLAESTRVSETRQISRKYGFAPYDRLHTKCSFDEVQQKHIEMNERLKVLRPSHTLPNLRSLSKQRLFGSQKKGDHSDSFLARFTVACNPVPGNTPHDFSKDQENIRANFCNRFPLFLTSVIKPWSTRHYLWLAVISACILYNLNITIARVAFTALQEDFLLYWLVLDYLCDAIYIGDMIVRCRTGYMENGIMVKESTRLVHHYIYSSGFKLDLLSILPTDLLYLVVGIQPALRLNRLLRFQRLQELIDRHIRRTDYPNFYRIVILILNILIIIHWNACFYFIISRLLGYGSDEWVYPQAPNTNQTTLSQVYIYSFYWSTLTLLTIGETPHPVTEVEYAFVIADYLIGVLVFATIVGNIGSIITNMNHENSFFTQKLDAVKRYLKIRKVNPQLQKKVISWFDYLRNKKHSLNEEDVMDTLPEKLRAEIAIHVHLETLKQVHIFKDCEPGLLVELVLKLKLQVFSPGDFICRKGDIGREMYIVKKGVLKVFSDEGQVYATLTDGNVFGEISILEIPGSKTGNRRNANVLSIGFSDCFVLSKSDLWSILQDYPADSISRVPGRGQEGILKCTKLPYQLGSFETRQKLIERGRQILALDNMLMDDDVQSIETNTSERWAVLTLPASCSQSESNARMNVLERNIDNLTRNISKLMAEFENHSQRLKERLTFLEKSINSPCTATE